MSTGFSSWWRKRSSSRVKKQENQSFNNKTVEPKKDEDDLGKPTRGEYAGEAAKEFFKVLEAVAQAIPVPGVFAAVKVATTLIKMCEDSQATLERAEELKLRVKTLVTVLVDELKGKKADEIQEKLKANIASLERDLVYIQKKLSEISSQSTILIILFKSFNEEKVGKCISRLNNSLERFNLTREIDHANLLNRLEKQILDFHAGQQEMLQSLKLGIDDVKAILDKRLPGATSCSHSRSRAVMPANTSVFYGRDTVVAELVTFLTNRPEGQNSPRACLLGPCGMGKTSTALAVMTHPDMKKNFPDSNQVWVPCVKATSIPLFLDTLSSSLGITKTSGDARNDILSELKSAEPLVLLLDNFETPWNVDGGRSETERMLRDIEQIPHITLFVTMRSSAPPGTGIRWHSVDLKAVDAQAAHQIYSEIYAEGIADPNIPELLQAVGYMPLAVTLMAKFGSLTGFSAKDLVEQYKRAGTTILGQGSDAENSMDICIGLSIDSPPMKRNLETFQLLAILAMLPVGTTANMLMSWWAGSLRNAGGALQVLRETSLVERQNSTFVVLPVIQRYILDPSRFPHHVRTSMVKCTCNFLAQHKSSPGETSYKEHTTALSAEEGNLQAILLKAKAPTSDLVDALLVLAQHQRWTRPRTDIIEHALELTREMEDSSKYIGLVQECYGHILLGQNRNQDALEQYRLARKHFISVDDRYRAAMGLLHQCEVYFRQDGHTLAEHEALIEEAKADFELIDDTHGVALCLYYLGRSYLQLSDNYTRAIDLLRRAKEMSKESLHRAHCSNFMASAYYYAKQWEEAQICATSAAQEYEKIGYYEPGLMWTIGRVGIAKGAYDGVLKELIQSLERTKSYGEPMWIAAVLELIGLAWALSRKKVDARGAFEESMHYYSSIHARSDVTRCRFFLRKLEDPGLIPSEEERPKLRAAFPFEVEHML